MNKQTYIAIFLSLVSIASAASWSGSVDTNTSSWSIHRQSATAYFEYTDSVEGTISSIQVTPAGRSLRPYISNYADVNFNDVRLRERTAAQEGVYSSEELIKIRAEAEKDVNLTITKPAGSDIWTIKWSESWPVVLNASRSIDYAGKNINHRDYVGNNLDYVGSNYLHNKEFSKDRRADLYLEKMNATILATDERIILAEFMPTKSIDYEIESHSTGIADLIHKFMGADRTTVISEGEERYEGVFDIRRKIGVQTKYDGPEEEKDWLSCCVGEIFRYQDIEPIDSETCREVAFFGGTCRF